MSLSISLILHILINNNRLNNSMGYTYTVSPMTGVISSNIVFKTGGLTCLRIVS